MCWALFLAAESEPPQARSDRVDDGFMIWPEQNPWIPLALGPTYRCWVVGHFHHCSCGCVRSAHPYSHFTLDAAVLNYLADSADAVGHLVIAARFCRANFENEELPFEITSTRTSLQLRSSDPLHFDSDTFVWIQGDQKDCSETH